MRHSKSCEWKAELAGCVVRTRKLKQFKAWIKSKPFGEDRDRDLAQLSFIRQGYREDARVYHLALGHLRGMVYERMEPKTHLNVTERRELAKRVSKLSHYGPEDIEAWMGLTRLKEAAA